MRLPSVLNWTLLCLNTLLFVVLLVISLISLGRPGLNPAAHRRLADGPVLGMEVCDEIGPFVLLTGNSMYVRQGTRRGA